MAPMKSPLKQELARVSRPLNLSQEFCFSSSLCPQDETVVIPALGTESSFTASIMVLKLVVKRSLLVVLETMQLAFLGACHPKPRMQIHVFSPQTWSREALFLSGNQGRKTNVRG